MNSGHLLTCMIRGLS